MNKNNIQDIFNLEWFLVRKENAMGMWRPFSRCANHENQKPVLVYEDKNPNPYNFKITKLVCIGRYTIVKIVYPDCKNFEGRKILMFKDHSEEELRSRKDVDPHFCDVGTCRSPIARFQPTEFGWKCACMFARMLMKEQEGS